MVVATGSDQGGSLSLIANASPPGEGPCLVEHLLVKIRGLGPVLFPTGTIHARRFVPCGDAPPRDLDLSPAASPTWALGEIPSAGPLRPAGESRAILLERSAKR